MILSFSKFSIIWLIFEKYVVFRTFRNNIKLFGILKIKKSNQLFLNWILCIFKINWFRNWRTLIYSYSSINFIYILIYLKFNWMFVCYFYKLKIKKTTFEHKINNNNILGNLFYFYYLKKKNISMFQNVL